jgi:Ca-activated chloride channel family protein
MNSSGLSAVWADLRTFLAGVSFDRPGLLWLGLVPLSFVVLTWLGLRQQRTRLAKIGRPGAVASLLTGSPGPSRLGVWFRSFAWLGLTLGVAGPRWGPGEPDGVAFGRDMVLIVDLSRSMLADDCAGGKARWQAAVAGGVDLLEYLKTRGGHRVAVVAFAARPVLLCPLTTDFDHARAKLNEINGKFPPPGVRPDRDDFPSGTRIGAAVAFAVESLDERFLAFRDVIVLSDGDDPADDREWSVGVSAARKAGVPVHCVGLGDPVESSLIPLGDGPLEFAGPGAVPDVVRTKLNEAVLRSLAAEARGQYLSAKRAVPDLAAFVRTAVEPNPARELTDDQLPQKRLRSGWFYAAAALFLLLWRGRT